jgi:NDP-sugar pyrophosphorylase family protein
MPAGDRPVLDIVIRQLRHHSFDRITIATGHLAELIEAFFGDGSCLSVPIDYFRRLRSRHGGRAGVDREL